MAVLVILIAVAISVALFFILALKFGRDNAKSGPKEEKLDLEAFAHRPTKTPLPADEEDELIV